MSEKDVGFYIRYDNKIYQLPINPSEINVSYSSNNKTIESIWLGDLNLLKGRKLFELSFKSFLPATASSFPDIRTQGQFLSPGHYKVLFDKMLRYGRPGKLTITGLSYAINFAASLEKFDYDIRAGEHEDVYYSVTFKEYKEYGIKEIPINDNLKRYLMPSSNKSAQSARSSNVVLTPTKVTKGCTVILNGTVCYDSYGSKPGKTFKNYKGKVNLINSKGTHPYHVTTMSGGWLGWVKKSEVVVA